jgi:hypothetical protein
VQNQNRVGLTIILVSLAGIVLLLRHLILNRLTKDHAGLFAEMGTPKVDDSNLRRSYWALERFIWWGHLAEVKDTQIHVLCILTCMSELAFGVSCFV